MLSGAEFAFRNGVLSCEDVDLTTVAARHHTPAYVYSKRAIINGFRAYDDALTGLPHRVCYAVKANSNLAVLATLAREGAGFDIVSGGELYRVLAAGGNPATVVFSGVGKTESEIRFALVQGIHSFNCESEPELELISRCAVSLGRIASIAIRINPDVNALTHPYISTGLREHKFGVDIEAAEAIYCRAMQLPGIAVEGVSCHIGSQLLDVSPLLEAADKITALVKRLRKRSLAIQYLDLGGGVGVPYRSSERGVSVTALVEKLRPKIEPLDITLMLEPGRSVVADAGVLLTRVLLLKQNGPKSFVIVDAAMNDLIRPALYQAHHEIVPVNQPSAREEIKADIVGPVCETGDFFARGCILSPVRAGDLLAIRTVGAYGFVLASNYNGRPRPCELLIDGDQVHVARKRETWEDLVRGESRLSEFSSEITTDHLNE
jgi:diaminopimelate decarboxylase